MDELTVLPCGCVTNAAHCWVCGFRICPRHNFRFCHVRLCGECAEDFERWIAARVKNREQLGHLLPGERVPTPVLPWAPNARHHYFGDRR